MKRKIIIAGRGEIDSNKIKNDPVDRKVVFRIQFTDDDFFRPFKINK